MQVLLTYIVNDNGMFKVLYRTIDNIWFVSTRIIGTVKQITNEEALQLIAAK